MGSIMGNYSTALCFGAVALQLWALGLISQNVCCVAWLATTVEDIAMYVVMARTRN